MGVSVLFGSALSAWGVRRLLKALRHEVPDPAIAAERLGASDGCAFVFKVSNSGAMGRLTYARIFGAGLKEGDPHFLLRNVPRTALRCRSG